MVEAWGRCVCCRMSSSVPSLCLTHCAWSTARLEGKANSFCSQCRVVSSCSLEAGSLPAGVSISQLCMEPPILLGGGKPEDCPR